MTRGFPYKCYMMEDTLLHFAVIRPTFHGRVISFCINGITFCVASFYYILRKSYYISRRPLVITSCVNGRPLLHLAAIITSCVSITSCGVTAVHAISQKIMNLYKFDKYNQTNSIINICHSLGRRILHACSVGSVA